MRILNKGLWPHRVLVEPDIARHEAWLLEHMGPMRGRWNVTEYKLRNIVYYFRDERDAMWFTLRWT